MQVVFLGNLDDKKKMAMRFEMIQQEWFGNDCP